MQVNDLTSADIYFGPLHRAAGASGFYVDDTTATSLYLTSRCRRRRPGAIAHACPGPASTPSAPARCRRLVHLCNRPFLVLLSRRGAREVTAESIGPRVAHLTRPAL